MQVELVAADRLVWSGEARSVLARTTAGTVSATDSSSSCGVPASRESRVKKPRLAALSAYSRCGMSSRTRPCSVISATYRSWISCSLARTGECARLPSSSASAVTAARSSGLRWMMKNAVRR